MRKREIVNSQVILASACAILILIVVSACSQSSFTNEKGQLSPSLNKVEKPQYLTGTVFVFSNGSWNRVVSTQSGEVSWVDHKGNQITGSPDFTYPPADWESTNYRGEREFSEAKFLFSKMPTTLWPLQVGNKSGFIEQHTWQKKEEGQQRAIAKNSNAYWSCEVEGQEKVTVPAGEFDTWKITCARYSGAIRSTTAYAREYRTWFYAPEIQHWVAMEREKAKSEAGQLKRRELVAVMPSLNDMEDVGHDDKQSMQELYQSVLEGSQTGERVMWKSTDGNISMAMNVTGTFRRKESMVCRQYSQDLEISGNSWNYYGVACRNSKGEWSVPRRGR